MHQVRSPVSHVGVLVRLVVFSLALSACGDPGDVTSEPRMVRTALLGETGFALSVPKSFVQSEDELGGLEWKPKGEYYPFISVSTNSSAPTLFADSAVATKRGEIVTNEARNGGVLIVDRLNGSAGWSVHFAIQAASVPGLVRAGGSLACHSSNDVGHSEKMLKFLVDVCTSLKLTSPSKH